VRWFRPIVHIGSPSAFSPEPAGRGDDVVRPGARELGGTRGRVLGEERHVVRPALVRLLSLTEREVRLHELLVRHALRDEDVRHGVQDREVGAGRERDVQVGEARGRRDARVEDDDLHVASRLLPPRHALEDDRVRLGGVRAHEEHHVRVVDVLVAAHRLVLAVRRDVAAYRRRHAEAGVPLHVVRADARLEELVRRVRLLGEPLAGAVEADRVRAVLRDGGLEPRRDEPHRLVPARRDELAALAHERTQAAIRRGHDLRQEEAL
jgi:hypothetical protein